MAHLRSRARDLSQQPDQRVQARLHPARQLEHPAADARRLCRGDQAGGEVVDVDEVSGLLSVAVDGQGLAVKDAADEERYDVRLARGARPVGVREADGDRRHAVGAVEGGAIRLAGRLSGAVR